MKQVWLVNLSSFCPEPQLSRKQISAACYVGSDEHKVERWWGGLPAAYVGASGKATRPKLASGDPSAAFVAELTEAVRAVRAGAASPLLDARLACDAVWLCRKETESALRHRPVKV